MDENLKSILDADIGKIAEDGKKAGKTKRKKITMIAVLMAIACVLGFFAVRELDYRQAISLADKGQFQSAYEKFVNLHGYKSSDEYAKMVIAANEFMCSETYEYQLELEEVSAMQVGNSISSSFDWRSGTLIVRITMHDFAAADFESINGEAADIMIPLYLSLCYAIDDASGVMRDAFLKDGFSVNCQMENISSDDILLYSSLNGEEKYSLIDVAAHAEEIYGDCYQAIKAAVDSSDYASACNIWDDFNSDGWYGLDYEDIADYYYYADAMQAYLSNDEIVLSDLVTKFSKVSSGFKDTNEILSHIVELKSAVNGKYKKSSGYGLSIQNGHVETFPVISVGSYFQYAGDGELIMKGQKIHKLNVTLSYLYERCNMSITFNETDITVKCSQPPAEEMKLGGVISLYYASSVERELSGVCKKAV